MWVELNKALDYIYSVLKMVEQGDIRYVISIEYKHGVSEVAYADSGGNYHKIKMTENGQSNADL